MLLLETISYTLPIWLQSILGLGGTLGISRLVIWFLDFYKESKLKKSTNEAEFRKKNLESSDKDKDRLLNQLLETEKEESALKDKLDSKEREILEITRKSNLLELTLKEQESKDRIMDDSLRLISDKLDFQLSRMEILKAHNTSLIEISQHLLLRLIDIPEKINKAAKALENTNVKVDDIVNILDK